MTTPMKIAAIPIFVEAKLCPNNVKFVFPLAPTKIKARPIKQIKMPAMKVQCVIDARRLCVS